MPVTAVPEPDTYANVYGRPRIIGMENAQSQELINL
jgi:hypothetical protein